MCLAIVFKWPTYENVALLVHAEQLRGPVVVWEVSLPIIGSTASVRMYYIIGSDNVPLTSPVVPDRQ
jgi:hypothetical protein